MKYFELKIRNEVFQAMCLSSFITQSESMPDSMNFELPPATDLNCSMKQVEPGILASYTEG